VREIETCWITLSDGTRLAARLYLPEGAEQDPVPAILEYIPYRRRDASILGDAPRFRYLAGHGYAGVRVDIRGSGDSEGLLHDEYLLQEQLDGVEVIAWIARQPWCSGSVGMIGISWGGFNSLQVAAHRPPALKAIITVCSTDDRYADDCHYMGGALLTDNLGWASTMLGYCARPPDPEVVGERWRTMWRERLENIPLLAEIWTRHQRRDAYWKHASVCEDYSAIACAVYAVGGWADAYTNAIPRLLAGLRCPRKGLIGPWAHEYPERASPGPAIGFLQEQLRWWDHWLKGRDSGIMDEPMLRVWMQDSAPPAAQYAIRPGRWVAETAWPSPRIATRSWFLGARSLLAQGRAADESVLIDSPQTTGITWGVWCPYGADGELPTDQRPDDGRAVSFDSEPLAERLEILGAPVAHLALACDRSRGQIALRLCDVAPDGASTLVTYGILNLTHRDGHESPTPLEPGRRYAIRLQLNDAAHSFAPGHRLRLSVSTAYWPMVWPAPDRARVTLHTDASRLDLPVRPPRAEDAALVAFPAPEMARAPDHEVVRPARRDRTVFEDPVSGVTDVTVHRGRAVALKHIALRIDHEGEEHYRIRPDDPLSAHAETRRTHVMQRGDWRIRTETRTVMSVTRDAFLISATLDAYESDVRFFSRCWTSTIPRDLV
jgi:hypothetical protein